MSIIEHADYYETPMYGVSHTHTSCEIMYITGGRVTVEADGREFVLTAGHSLLIKSRCHHAARAAADMDYKRFIAVVNPWEIRKQLVRPDLFALLTDASKGGAVHLKNAEGLLPGVERMREIFLSGGNIYDELAAALTVLSGFYESAVPVNETGAVRSGVRITERVREYLEQNFAENIKISQIAGDNFISEGYLSHTFKEVTGISPREYLTHIRCARAYELIRHTDMKFSDIAGKTGFCCANDMSRKIREFYGRTPTKIRFGGDGKD